MSQSVPVTLNTRATVELFAQLKRWGVQTLCVCPGARNAPWVGFLECVPESFQVFYFFEERSAAFFALGKMMAANERGGQPVAVLTTSGTAVAELLPAVMEAFYSGLPLVVVSADRPRRYRGQGAPQVAEQVGLFSHYVAATYDLAFEELVFTSSQPLGPLPEALPGLPVHLNVCLDEPLGDKGLTPSYCQAAWAEVGFRQQREQPEASGTRSLSDHQALAEMDAFLAQATFPWIIVGGLPPEARSAVADFLKSCALPVFLESTSGLRDVFLAASGEQTETGPGSELPPVMLQGGETFMQWAGALGYPVGSVLRIGGVPTLRFWRDLESVAYAGLPVLSLSARGFSGLARPSFAPQLLLTATTTELLPAWPSWAHTQERFFTLLALFRSRLQVHLQAQGLRQWGERREGQQVLSRLRAFDQEWWLGQQALLAQEPQSEPAMMASLGSKLPDSAHLFLGNSLAVREWDGLYLRKPLAQVAAVRGLNGIDGQVSTFFGFAPDGTAEAWAFLGDLTVLYDLAAPWVLAKMQQVSLRLVIINNQGGQIFSRLFPYASMLNQHDLRFQDWAKFWRLDYLALESVPQGPLSLPAGPVIIELLPEGAATERLGQKKEQLLQQLLAQRRIR